MEFLMPVAPAFTFRGEGFSLLRLCFAAKRNPRPSTSVAVLQTLLTYPPCLIVIFNNISNFSFLILIRFLSPNLASSAALVAAIRASRISDNGGFGWGTNEGAAVIRLII